MLSKRLQGKVAVVTGTGSGIGQGCTLMFARHGASVMGCDIDAVAAQATLDQARGEACEGGPHNIRANSISPAMIVTGATRAELEKPGYTEAILDKLMIKRRGQPEDIAWFATYLVSDEASCGRVPIFASMAARPPGEQGDHRWPRRYD